MARVVELLSEAKAAELGRALTIDQAKVLLSSIVGHRMEALFTLMLMLGLRPGEATGLAWATRRHRKAEGIPLALAASPGQRAFAS